MASIESIFMYPVAYLPKISIFTSYKEIETDDSAGYNGTDNQESAGADSRSPGGQPFPCRIQRETAGTDGCAATEDTGTAFTDSMAEPSAFGRRSEKLAVLDPNQLSLFNPVPATGQNEDIREEDSSAAAPSKAKPDGKKKESRRNRELLEGLPVIEVVIEPDRVDLDRYRRIGEERTRTLEFEPGRLYVKETVRPKYGLKDNLSLPKEGESGVIIAPLPPSPVYKCLAGSTMLAEMLLQKYEYHVPFYRQVKEFRHLGVRLSESTLSGWFKPVCELLRPLYDELVRLVVGCGYVQADETTVRVISKGKGKADKEYLWMVRAVMEKLVIFHYDDGSRSGQTIRKLLKDFKGYLQSDGYSAYNVFEGTEEVCLIACLAHIRRHFEMALEENRSLAEHALK